MSSDELEAAWAAVHEATPEGWYVGRPSEHPERREWVMFAFDTRERAIEGKRAGEWTTVAPTELDVVRSMAYCLRELGAGRWPKWGTEDLVTALAALTTSRTPSGASMASPKITSSLQPKMMSLSPTTISSLPLRRRRGRCPSRPR